MRQKQDGLSRLIVGIVLGTETAELPAELARCDVADLVKLFGAPPRHERTSRAAAHVSTVDTLPADQPASGPEHGPAWGRPVRSYRAPCCKWRIRQS
jgi:hypothetical protein